MGVNLDGLTEGKVYGYMCTVAPVSGATGPIGSPIAIE